MYWQDQSFLIFFDTKKQTEQKPKVISNWKLYFRCTLYKACIIPTLGALPASKGYQNRFQSLRNSSNQS